MVKKDPHGWTKAYDCRFRKRQPSSKKNPDVPVEKQRKTSFREPILCQAQITITLKNGMVTIRKTHQDGPNHTHDLKTSDVLKKPSEVIDFIKVEASKGYRAPAIKEAAAGHFSDKQIGADFLQSKSVINTQRN